MKDQFKTSNHIEDICDPSSPCEGFTDEEIAEDKCRLETLKK